MEKSASFPTPLLRVSRPVSACRRCRAAKVRCDGKLPACTACEKAGRSEECSSVNDQFAKGKERNYVASLETHIAILEQRIARAKYQNASVDMLGVASAAGLLPSNLRPSAGNQKRERQEASNVDDLVSDFGFLSVNATARDFHGFTGEMSFARLVLSISSLEPVPTDSALSFPQRHEMTPLIQHYLEKIHVLYPFLPETLLFSSIDKVCGQNGLYATPSDQWITMMVLAISHASQARVRGDSYYQESLKYTAAALRYGENVIRPGSRSGIQAILLMVLLSMWLPHHFNSWYLIGVASRAAVDLGLHHDSQSELRIRIADDDIRCRVFECVYSLDRSISMVHQRPFSFTDDSTNRTGANQASKTSTWHSLFSVSLKPFEDLLTLRRIQSAFYQKLFQSELLSKQAAWPIIRKAVHDMAEWYSALLPQTNGADQFQYRSEILYSIVLMMSPPNWMDDLPMQGKYLLLQYAMEYAKTIHLAISGMSGGFDSFSSHNLSCISFVAQRFLALMNRDQEILLSKFIPSLSPNILDPVTSSDKDSSWPLLDLSLLLTNNQSEHLNRIYSCLSHFERALNYFCKRYGYSDPLREYQIIASSLGRTLSNSMKDSAQGRSILYSS